MSAEASLFSMLQYCSLNSRDNDPVPLLFVCCTSGKKKSIEKNRFSVSHVRENDHFRLLFVCCTPERLSFACVLFEIWRGFFVFYVTVLEYSLNGRDNDPVPLLSMGDLFSLVITCACRLHWPVRRG